MRTRDRLNAWNNHILNPMKGRKEASADEKNDWPNAKGTLIPSSQHNITIMNERQNQGCPHKMKESESSPDSLSQVGEQLDTKILGSHCPVEWGRVRRRCYLPQIHPISRPPRSVPLSLSAPSGRRVNEDDGRRESGGGTDWREGEEGREGGRNKRDRSTNLQGLCTPPLH